MTHSARLSPPWADAGTAPGPVSCDGPGAMSALSLRDEEIVLRARAALGHDLLDVVRALNLAWLLGIPTFPTDAAPADRRDRRIA